MNKDITDIIELFLMISGIAYWVEMLVGIKRKINKGDDKE